MESIFSRVTQQAMNYAIRSGIAITSGYAIDQCSRLIKKTSDGRDRDELAKLKNRLGGKIRIISPAIDMIELITARGNTSLESAVALAKSIRVDIQDLGIRLSKAAADEDLSRHGSSRAKAAVEKETHLQLIIADMKSLLLRIEDAVPLINLAITTSGVNLSTNLPASISPSRLLQASTFLSAGDAQYTSQVSCTAPIGPAFTLSMYMLFAGHANRPRDEEGLRSTTWKEVIHKARVKLMRVPLDSVCDSKIHSSQSERKGRPPPGSDEMRAVRRGDEFAYHLLVVEDLDDGRVHSFEDATEPGWFDDVENAGIREVLPIHEVSKIFYADTGKVLNIGSEGETHNPVLLLKRDVNATPPRRMVEGDVEADTDTRVNPTPASTENIDDTDSASGIEAQIAREANIESNVPHGELGDFGQWRLPSGLDLEWVAFEVFTDDHESDTESEADAQETETSSGRQDSLEPNLTSSMSRLCLASSPAVTTPDPKKRNGAPSNSPEDSPRAGPAQLPDFEPRVPVRTSLSLLEMLIRLTSLQQFQQASHLTITDELLNFFLEESSTTGAAVGDAETRQRIRREARHRVGFDPYDESPVKRRGEHYRNPSRDEVQFNRTSRWGSSSNMASSTPATPNSLGNTAFSFEEAFSSPEQHDEAHSAQYKPSPTLDGAQASRGTRQGPTSLATPPATTKSRQAFLRSDEMSSSGTRRSPLSRVSFGSSEANGSEK